MSRDDETFSVSATTMTGRGFGTIAFPGQLLEVAVQALQFAGFPEQAIELKTPEWVRAELKASGYTLPDLQRGAEGEYRASANGC